MKSCSRASNTVNIVVPIVKDFENKCPSRFCLFLNLTMVSRKLPWPTGVLVVTICLPDLTTQPILHSSHHLIDFSQNSNIRIQNKKIISVGFFPVIILITYCSPVIWVFTTMCCLPYFASIYIILKENTNNFTFYSKTFFNIQWKL